MGEALPETVCGVCGGPLAPPVAACPRCESPHHLDCWDYNGGCSVYGCKATEVQPTAVIPVEPESGGLSEDLPGERVEVEFDWIGPVLLFVFALMFVGITGFQVLAVPVTAAFLFWALRSNERIFLTGGTAQLPEPLLDEVGIETKAVLAHVGQGTPDELAHAYGLFEQRHPKARLPVDAQRALALELQAGGYAVLAAEALDKLLGREGEEKIREAYRQLFHDQPAFWEELRRVLPDGTSLGVLDIQPLISREPQYLLAHARAGFPIPWRHPTLLPTEPKDAEPDRTLRIAGPFPNDELIAHADDLRAQGHLVLPATYAELALPGEVHEVDGMAFLSKCARFHSEDGEFTFGWDEVRTYFYERLERQDSERVRRTEMVRGPRGGERAVESDRLQLRTEYTSVLEVHAGDPLKRFRVYEPSADLFHYLGRRRQLAYEPNLRLATKDLARFAPHARASRGVYALFSERQGQEVSYRNLREFEEYVLWFHAMSSPRIREWWAGLGLGG